MISDILDYTSLEQSTFKLYPKKFLLSNFFDDIKKIFMYEI